MYISLYIYHLLMCLDSFRFDIPEITEAGHCVHFGVSTSLKARNPMLEDFG